MHVCSVRVVCSIQHVRLWALSRSQFSAHHCLLLTSDSVSVREGPISTWMVPLVSLFNFPDVCPGGPTSFSKCKRCMSLVQTPDSGQHLHFLGAFVP